MGMTRTASTIDRYRATTTEAGMRRAIADLVALRGGRLWFVEDSRNCPEMTDAPDVLILVPGVVVVAELKSQRRRFTAGQIEVAALLASVERAVCVVVRPNPKDGELSYDQLLEVLS